MKQFVLVLATFLAIQPSGQAQIINPRDAARDAASDRVNGDIKSGVNNAADQLDNSIKNRFKKSKPTDNATAQANPQSPSPQSSGGSGGGSGSLKTYSNYDFVPGDRVIFEDNFQDDQDGEFPSHWNLGAGQAILNKINDKESLLLTEGNYAHVSPLNKKAAYLTDTFTLEFDSYANEGYGPHIYFYGSTDDALHGNNDLGMVYISSGANVSNHDKTVDLQGSLPEEISGENYKNKWHHIAIAFRHNQLKVYIDQYRILTVPNLPITPRAFDIEGIGSTTDPIVMTNFRVANGGNMNMYTKKFTDAKIITHGINFDVDMATIKPESMGTLNAIKSILNDNPGLRFEIDGHTDNSGSPAHNLSLSQQRAEAVKQQLISMGIDASRLTTKGLGDTKPMSDNTSLEGKANNRRVEFVRL